MNKAIVSLVFSCFLISCGGGSDKSSEPVKLPTIKLSKSIIYIQAKENGTANTFKEEISFEIENLNSKVYVAAKNNSPELIDRIYLPVLGNLSGPPTSTVTIYPAQPYFTQLKAGTYQGSISLVLCEDNLCAKQIPGSSLVINVIYDVLI